MTEKREYVAEIIVNIEKLHPDDHLFVERELIRFAKRLGIDPIPQQPSAARQAAAKQSQNTANCQLPTPNL